MLGAPVIPAPGKGTTGSSIQGHAWLLGCFAWREGSAGKNACQVNMRTQARLPEPVGMVAHLEPSAEEVENGGSLGFSGLLAQPNRQVLSQRESLAKPNKVDDT